MALITTKGASDANSYVSLAEANAYFETRLNSSDWTSASDPNKEKALASACRIIDMQAFKGSKVYTTSVGDPNYQKLQWPRYADDSDTYMLGIPHLMSTKDSNEWVDSTNVPIIPEKLKLAQCEQALFMLRHMEGSDKRQSLRAQGVSSFNVGGVSESYENREKLVESAKAYLVALKCINSSLRINRR